jgi:hypothetical protein
MRGASRGVREVGQGRRPRVCLASTLPGGPGQAVRRHYRPAALNGWTRRGRRRAEVLRIRGPGGPRLRPEARRRGQKSPQVERREASASSPDAPAPRKARTHWWRLAALHPLAIRARARKDRPPRAFTKNRGGGALAFFHGRAVCCRLPESLNKRNRCKIFDGAVAAFHRWSEPT